MSSRGRAIAGIVAVLSAMLFVTHEPILLAVGDFLVLQDVLQPADVIHVISGADYRTDYAIQLYKQGYGKQILFTGGWCSIHRYYHGRHGAERAAMQGVASGSIIIDESTVTSTFDEAVLVQKFIAGSPTAVRSVMVISDPYHMRRVRWTYRKILGDDVLVELAPVPFEATPYQRIWWSDPASRQYVTQEYLKTVYYFARYQLGWDWLASFDRE